MLLAGGVGSRLNILASKRAKPAIPYGGIYRIIDFTMSNITNTNIDVVGILTQYKPLSLMEHLDNGRPWDLFGRTRLVEILPPKTGEEIFDWYKGTSDAVYQNLGFIEDFSPEYVLVVSGDHIYYMNYNFLWTFHKEKKAEVTICLIRVPEDQAHNFGIAVTDEYSRIVDWEEKPKRPKSNLASMGIYMFKMNVLREALREAARIGGTDFARHVMPIMLRNNRVFGFEFKDYWRDVGTIDAYWNANMDIIRPNAGLNIEAWQIKTNLSVKGEIGDRPSTYFSRICRVLNSLISRGCIIEGTVRNSILSPGVKIGKDATICDSVIFHDVTIGPNSLVNKAIIDKNVVIGKAVQIGIGRSVPNQKFPDQLFTDITMIGKNAKIAPDIQIGKNCIINPNVNLMGINVIESGITV